MVVALNLVGGDSENRVFPQPFPALPDNASMMKKTAQMILLSLMLAVSLTACGESYCDDLADICEACPNPAAKATCEAHVEVGDEDVCELDVKNAVFEQVCSGSR